MPKNNKGFSHILLFVVFLLAAITLGVFFVTRNKSSTLGYIDTSMVEQVAGASSGECTPELVVGASERFTSISAAVNSVKSNAAGKVICVKDNKVYNELVRIDASGAVGNPLVVKSHPANNTLPKITTTAPYPTWQDRLSGKSALVVTGDNVEVEGFEVIRATGTGITASEVENVKIRNVISHDTYGDGLQVLHSRNVIVSGCKLYNNEMIGTVTDCIKQHPSVCTIGEVLKVRFSNTVTIENCVVTDDKSPHRGGVLNMGDSNNLIIRNNELYKHDGNHLHMGGAENVLIENNYVFGICGFEGKGYYRNAERQPGDAPAYDYPGKNITIRNNLIVGMRTGIFFGGCEVRKVGSNSLPWIGTDNCQFEDILVENNTVVGTGVQNSGDDEEKEYALWIDAMQGDPVRNVNIRNNIFHSTNDGNGYGGDLSDRASGTKTYVNNIWSNNSRLTANDRQVPNLTGVFANNPELNRCLTSRLNPDAFKVAQAFAGIGADTAKVGSSFTGSGGGDTPPSDADGDGVPNTEDQCSNTPAGTNPDPARRGCPLVETPPRDTDGDGIPNNLDQCPDKAAGTNPDENRRGCPSDEVTPPLDADGDGFPNTTDQCDNRPAGTNPDPNRLGCPRDDTTPPVRDDDGDGIPNTTDQCVRTPAGSSPDPAKLGCPLESPTTPPKSGENVLFNSQFALPARNRTELARQWFYSDGKLGKVKVELVQIRNEALARDYAAKVTVVTKPRVGYVSLNQQNIRLKPNTKYQLTFSAKSSAAAELLVTFSDMGLIESALAPRAAFSLNTDWKAYAAEITTTNFSPSKLAKVTFGYKADQNNVLHIDNVFMREVQ